LHILGRIKAFTFLPRRKIHIFYEKEKNAQINKKTHKARKSPHKKGASGRQRAGGSNQ